jgi:hypothetical protein
MSPKVTARKTEFTRGTDDLFPVALGLGFASSPIVFTSGNPSTSNGKKQILNGAKNMNASAIYSLFETAISHELKFPKIRLRASNGGTVVLKLNGSRSKYEGSIAVTDDRPFGENSYYGRIERNGAWIPGRDSSPAIVALFDALAANPAEVASEYGRLTGNCCFCSTPLKDARSTAVGYGPICAEHFGLPWGSPFSSSVDAPTKQQNERDAVQAEFELQADIRNSRVAIRERAERCTVCFNPGTLNADGYCSECVKTSEANPFAAVEFADNSSPEALLNDPCTPFWAQSLIRDCLTRDCVDVANVLGVLAQSFDARAKKLLGQ